MSYLCVKPLRLGGVDYAAGDNIPDGAVLKQRVRGLISMGYITQAAEPEKPNPAPPAPPANDPDPSGETGGEKTEDEGSEKKEDPEAGKEGPEMPQNPENVADDNLNDDSGEKAAKPDKEATKARKKQ